jgi:hypothetical protein
MKVIAKVSNTAFICEVSDEEIALLNGFRSKYDDGCVMQNLTVVGAECNLSKMAATSRYIRSMNKDTLKNAKDRLEDGIKTIDAAMTEISKLDLFGILSEEQKL